MRPADIGCRTQENFICSRRISNAGTCCADGSFSMAVITKKEVDRFLAEDKVGRRYTVVRKQDIIVCRPSGGSVVRIPGNIRYSLVTGEALDERFDSSFVVMNDATVLHKVGN